MSTVAVSPFDIRSKVNISGTILGCRMKRFPLRGIARSWDAKKIKKVPKDDRVPIELAFWPVAQANFFLWPGSFACDGLDDGSVCETLSTDR